MSDHADIEEIEAAVLSLAHSYHALHQGQESLLAECCTLTERMNTMSTELDVIAGMVADIKEISVDTALIVKKLAAAAAVTQDPAAKAALDAAAAQLKSSVQALDAVAATTPPAPAPK